MPSRRTMPNKIFTFQEQFKSQKILSLIQISNYQLEALQYKKQDFNWHVVFTTLVSLYIDNSEIWLKENGGFLN
jgi:hypothetical protein